MELQGKVAVITGGASGIGLATGRQLARRGAQLVLVDREEGALAEAAAGFAERSGRSEAEVAAPLVATRVCDVSDYPAMQALATDVVETFGRVDIVFNNAGVAVGGPIAEMSHDDWRWIIDVDLWGPIHGVEVFLPHMRRQGQGGHLLFTSSFAGLVPNVGLGPYCVAKYGVVALAEVLQRELREENIGVSVLCPMRVSTNIGSSERNRDASYGGVETSLEGSARVLDQDEGNPDLAGRVLTVDEVAARVVAAIDDNRLYILPHEESREFVRRRFERIDRAYEQ